MSATPNIALSYLVANQQNAEVKVNEAFKLLDVLVQPNCESSRRTSPPVSATEGQKWCIPPSATGAWSGHSGQVAVWWGGAWVFIVPQEGWSFWDKTNNYFVYMNFSGSPEWRRTIRVPLMSATDRPASPITAELLFNTTAGKAQMWDGSTWQDLW